MYGQFCGLARGLELIGDRWSLLLIRQLLAGPARFTDLKAGMPGIATNLLARRLADLTGAGVLEHRQDPGSGRGPYALTHWGEQLRRPLEQLAAWGTPLMLSGVHGDAVRPEWLVVALPGLLADLRRPAPARVRIRSEGQTILLDLGPAAPAARLSHEDGPVDAEIDAPQPALLAAISGYLPIRALEASGARLTGDRDLLEALLSGHADQADRAHDETPSLVAEPPS